ncbi:MAG: NnrS family protein [Alphaproteobacteria bacterium]
MPAENRSEYRGAPVLSSGFRPFYLLAAIFGVIQIPVWILLGQFRGVVPAQVNPLLWHGHETLFGFVGAFLGGFLLTAVADVTGRPPIRGAALRFVILVWIAGRLAWWIPNLSADFAIAIDLLFIPLLVGLALPDLIEAKRPRTKWIVGTLAFYWLGNVLIHVEHFGWLAGTGVRGLRLSLDSLLVMIAVIGGRIVPMITADEVGAARPRHAAPAWLDQAAIGALILFVIADVALPDGRIAGAVALVAGVLQLARLASWGGRGALGNPIVWILHLGYLWLGLGLLAVACAGLFQAFAPGVGIHALGIGAIATVMIAAMTREALDHTGRPLKAGLYGVAAYVLITVAAIARILSGALDGALGATLLQVAGVAWTLAFAAYLLGYGRYLIGPAVARK